MKLRAGDKISLEIVAKDLQRQINLEAKLNGKDKPDYKTVFELFDEDRNGSISVEELKRSLKKYQLVNELADAQLPALLAMFDKQKRGAIHLDDFTAFASELDKKADDKVATKLESADLQVPVVDSKWEEDFYRDDVESMTDNIPPVPVTKNADCDWLLWQLYRQACRIDPADPEGVVTELEGACGEMRATYKAGGAAAASSVVHTVSGKELWALVIDMKMQGNMTREMFIRSLKYLTIGGDGKDEDRVDYESLVKLVVRMGRAFNSLVQDRARQDDLAFPPLLEELKKYFQELSRERPDDKAVVGATPTSAVNLARYEKLFRRLDTDGDGMMTMKEFKLGLRGLHYKQEKEWTLRMIRRLFDLCDKNRDGLLSISEFNDYILEQKLPDNYRFVKKVVEEKEEEKLTLSFSDNEMAEDEDLFGNNNDDNNRRRKKILSDDELMKKVYKILEDIVPDEAGNSRSGSHREVVLNSVQRFFQRVDPEFKGVVTEERFKAFLRRSSLQDRLSQTELRRLIAKCKAPNSKSATKRRSSSAEVMFDYEKFYQLIVIASSQENSIGGAKAEAVFGRFKEAAMKSAANGRSFISLCSLLDHSLRGQMSREEFIHTAKMMDCPLSNVELESLLNYLPSSSSHVVRGSDGLDHQVINYRVVESVLSQQPSALPPSKYDLDPQYTTKSSQSGHHHLPYHFAQPPPNYSFAGPATTTRMSTEAYGFHHTSNGDMRTIATPVGVSITTPWATGAGKPLLFDRLNAAIAEKSRLWGGTFSLKKQFEVYDGENCGLVSLRTFQSALQELGLSASPPELQALVSQFGRPEDDKIYYDSFCRALQNYSGTASSTVRQSESYPLFHSQQQHGEGARSSTQLVNQSQQQMVSYNNDQSVDFVSKSMMGLTSRGPPAYVNSRVLQRVRDLRREGRDPRDLFEAQDLDRTGMVSLQRFREVVATLQLLQSEIQLSAAVEDCMCVTNRGFVMYDDFCGILERALLEDNPRSSQHARESRDRTSNVNMSATRGGNILFGDEDTYNIMRKGTQYNANYPIELEEGSDYLPQYNQSFSRNMTSNSSRGLSPPKLTDSANFSSRKWNTIGTVTPSRYANSSVYTESNGELSPRRSVKAPPISPSKAGSKMWGTRTPLSKKGHALKVDSNKWCCTVCLYVENPIEAENCIVCDSPNYNSNKDYQVKEQCRNCTFLNGQFAEECEMCGEPLSGSAAVSLADNRAVRREKHAEYY